MIKKLDSFSSHGCFVKGAGSLSIPLYTVILKRTRLIQEIRGTQIKLWNQLKISIIWHNIFTHNRNLVMSSVMFHYFYYARYIKVVSIMSLIPICAMSNKGVYSATYFF